MPFCMSCCGVVYCFVFSVYSVCWRGGVVIFWGCFLLGLLILGRDIFWLVGFLCDAVFCGVMVFWFGWFLMLWRFWGWLFLVWGWFQFLGGWFLFRFCSVFCAFGCCGLLFLCWGVGWFGGLVFMEFLGFCRVLPVCTVSNM